jgi:hypothetical protein
LVGVGKAVDDAFVLGVGLEASDSPEACVGRVL